MIAPRSIFRNGAATVLAAVSYLSFLYALVLNPCTASSTAPWISPGSGLRRAGPTKGGRRCGALPLSRAARFFASGRQPRVGTTPGPHGAAA